MTPDAAQKLVAALDLEIGRRWRKRRSAVEAAAKAEYVDPALHAAQVALDSARAAVEAAQAAVDEADEEEAAEVEARLSAAETALAGAQDRLLAAERTAGLWQSIHVFARLLEWHADNPVPPGVVTESDEPSPDPAEFFAGVREICRKAEMLLEHEDAMSRGEPRRRAVIIGPRIRMPYGESRPASSKAKTGDADGKSKKLSRTEIWAEKQAEEAKARMALLPPRLAQPAPQRTELGWHRGEIISFDQIRKTGTVKFVGMVGITEAAITPDRAVRSGHANFFPGEKVDCRLVRHHDGSVVVADLKMASGLPPKGSESQQTAAGAERRFQIQLDRKWMH